MANNDELWNNLKRIRKKTGLNQEDFYKRYLDGCAPKKNSSASIQNWMSHLECGNLESIPIAILSIYAEIGNCSIADLFGDATEQVRNESPDLNTYSDLFRIIFSLCSCVCTPKLDRIPMPDGLCDTENAALSFNESGIIAKVFAQWIALLSMPQDAYTLDLIETWKQGILSQYEQVALNPVMPDEDVPLPFV